MASTSSFCLDDEAEIVFLKNMKGGNVIRSIAASEHDDLKTFGQRLLDWESIKLIEKKYGKQDAAIVAEAILETWIGRGEDTTYRRLIDCLKKTNMGGIARRIEAQATSADKRAQRTDSTNDRGQPNFSLDDEYDKPQTLQQDAQEEVEKVKDFAKNEVRIVIQSCNNAEYRAALEMLKPFSQDFNAPVKYPDTKLIIIVGIFAGQSTAIVQTGQGVECIEQLKRAFRILPKAKLLLGLGICYGIKENVAKIDLQFADVLVGRAIGISKRPSLESGVLDPRERLRDVQPLVFNIFCRDSKWDESIVCEVLEQRTAKVYVGCLCSASILMKDANRMKKIREQGYIGGEMEGWAQFEIPAQCIIIKGISDFGDGKKNDKWQLTAAKAAVRYAYYKVVEFGHIDYEELKTPSFEY